MLRAGAGINRQGAAAMSKEGLQAGAERTGLHTTPEAALVFAAIRHLVTDDDTLAEAELRFLTSENPDAGMGRGIGRNSKNR